MTTIDNAIIMAAGLGTRMRPLTYKTPKPLVKVAGQPMIESVIAALHANRIYDISIVVGYLADQFAYLVEKYDGVKLINNPYYLKYNNISSLYVARDELKNTVILDGDQVITNPDILSQQFKHSGYAGSWVDTWTDEWIMHTDEQHVVRSCDRDGGKDGWRLYSLSKWTQADSARLKYYLVKEFEQKKHFDIYWDDIAMFDYATAFSLMVQPIKSTDIVEIDSVEQLNTVSQQMERGFYNERTDTQN